MTTTRPHAAVVIPCFNHGRFVMEAVRSALGQADADVRVVIVNDGSTDGASPGECDACLALAPQGVVEVIHQSNAGLPAARNAGAALIAREGWGEYLVFLDADDWVQPSFVARLDEAIRAEPASAPTAAEVSHAYCQERLVDRASGLWQVPDWSSARLAVTNLHPVTALVRRSYFEAVGGFDVSLTKGYEDWDLWLKFAERSWRGVRVREPLFVWRRHAETTMVVEAAARHHELYAALVERHPVFFAAHALDALRIANAMLHRAEGAWVDESGEPIVLRDLRAWTRELVQERDEARAALNRHLVVRRDELGRLEAGVRHEYERRLGVRLGRGLSGLWDRLLRRNAPGSTRAHPTLRQ